MSLISQIKFGDDDEDVVPTPPIVTDNDGDVNDGSNALSGTKNDDVDGCKDEDDEDVD